MLLVRPLPKPGESFRGWISRIAFENGYRNGDWLCRHHLRSSLHRITANGALRIFGQQALSQLELDMLDGVVPQADNCCHSLRIGTSLYPDSHYRLLLRQVCPDCLADDGYARGSWESITSVTCRKHRSRFVSTCPGCMRPLSWTSSGLFHCKCGADLREARSLPENAALLEAEAVVTGNYSATAGPYSAGWAQLTDSERLDLMWTLGIVANGEPVKRSLSLTHERACGLFEAAGNALLDWPAPFADGLSRLDRGGASLRQSIGPAYQWICSLSRNAAFAPVTDILPQYVLAERKSPTHHRARQALKLSPIGRDAVTLTRAAKELGVSRKSAARLLDSKRLDGAEASAGTRSITLIDAEEVSRYRQQRQESVTRADASKILGLTPARFRELVEAGVLPVLEGGPDTGHSIYRLDSRRFTDFCSTLSDVQPICDAINRKGISLSTALRTRIHSGELAITLGAIAEARLPVIARKSGAGIVPSLVVDAQGLTDLLERHRSESSKSLSIMEAASALGIKQEVAYHLVTKGHLLTQSHGGPRRSGRRIGLDALETFRNTFIWLRDLANEAETSPKQMARILNRQGISPVTGPNIDGCRQILYLRESVLFVRLQIQ